MRPILGEWREGKVRPIPGNAPRARPVSRGVISLWSTCDDPFRTTRFPPLEILPEFAVGVFKAWRNLSGPMWSPHKNQKQNQTPGRDRAASRWSAPHPGRRTRREDHALAHRPQMSSGRLFLDRVARQQSPSPLHRHTQLNMHPARVRANGDISTLPGRGHFYFALTFGPQNLTSRRIEPILRSAFRSPVSGMTHLRNASGEAASPRHSVASDQETIDHCPFKAGRNLYNRTRSKRAKVRKGCSTWKSRQKPRR
jgi:hypothetical protein